jgi:hypothetical protein
MLPFGLERHDGVAAIAEEAARLPILASWNGLGSTSKSRFQTSRSRTFCFGTSERDEFEHAETSPWMTVQCV